MLNIIELPEIKLTADNRGMSYEIGQHIDLSYINTKPAQTKKSKQTIERVFASIQESPERYVFRSVLPNLLGYV